MDIEQSSVEDIGNAYHSECESDCGKANSADASADRKENLEGNQDISTILLTSSKNERNVSQPALQCMTEKISTECKIRMPRIVSPKISNKTDLRTSGTKENSSAIINCLIPDKAALECKANLTRLCSLEVFDGTDLKRELGSLEISNSANPDKNESANTANLPTSYKFIISDEFASECSPHLSTNIMFPKNTSRDGECRPSNTAERFLKLSEIRANRKTRERKRAVKKLSTQPLLQKDSQDKGADCQVVSPYQTKNISSECTSSSFQTFESSIPPEIDSHIKGNVSPASKSTVHDAATSDNKGNVTRKSSLEVSDESLVGTNFSSFRIPNFEDSEKNTFGLEEMPNTVILDRDSLNSVLQSQINTCFKSNLKRVSSQEVESLFKPSENFKRKRTKKQNSPLSPSEVGQGEEDNYHNVSLTKNNEIQTEFQGNFPRSNKFLTETVEAEENVSSLPKVNIPQAQDENTFVNFKILSSDCIYLLSKLQVSPGYGEDAKPIELARNLNDFTSSEANIFEYPIDLNKSSPNKISPNTESDQKENKLQGKTDSKNRDESKNSKQNRSRHFSSVRGNRKTRLNSSNVHRPFYYNLSDRPELFFNLKNPLSTKGSELEPCGNAEDTNERNRNQYQSRKAGNQLNSDSNKIDYRETINSNRSACCRLLSIEKEFSEISDVFRAIFLQLLLFVVSKFISDCFNDMFFLFLIFIAGYVFSPI